MCIRDSLQTLPEAYRWQEPTGHVARLLDRLLGIDLALEKKVAVAKVLKAIQGHTGAEELPAMTPIEGAAPKEPNVFSDGG
eukprot:10866089-Alexandrium_andersonii.AAC.1